MSFKHPQRSGWVRRFYKLQRNQDMTWLSLNSIGLHYHRVSWKDLLCLRQLCHEGGQLNSELSKLLSLCLQWEAGGCVQRSLLDNLIPYWPVFWIGAIVKDILQWGRLHEGADPWVCTLILSGKQFELQSTWHFHQGILNLMKAECHWRSYWESGYDGD